MINDRNLEGWAVTTLGGIADYINGRAFKPIEWQSNGIPIIRIQNLNNPDASYNYFQGELEDKYKVKTGDLLYSWSASLDSYMWSNSDAYLNQHIFNVKPYANINKLFIYYLLKRISSEILSKTHGMGMVHITKGKFEKIEIMLPPLNEQNRIVDKIETLFSEVDAGMANLTLAKRQLEQYRQSLLKHAFEGKLTAQWRENYAKNNGDPLPTADELLIEIQTARQAHYDQQIEEWEKSVETWEKEGKSGRKPSKPKNINSIATVDKTELDDVLPDCWSEHFLESLSAISGGLTKNSSRKTLEEQVPYLRVANVHANEFRLDDISYIGIKESEKPRVLLRKGDLLIVEGNGSIEHIGRVALWTGEIHPCYHQNHLIKARALNNVDPRYILYFLMSPIGRKRIVNVASSTTGLHTLSLSKISNLIIPLPSLDEQQEIVKQLEQKVSDADRLISDIDNQLLKANLLKTSILHKAFQGKLVPQNPNDPPASELLAQIKAEREAQALAEQQAKDTKKKRKSASKSTPKKKPKTNAKATKTQSKSNLAKTDADDATSKQAQIKLPL